MLNIYVGKKFHEIYILPQNLIELFEIFHELKIAARITTVVALDVNGRVKPGNNKTRVLVS